VERRRRVPCPPKYERRQGGKSRIGLKWVGKETSRNEGKTGRKRKATTNAKGTFGMEAYRRHGKRKLQRLPVFCRRAGRSRQMESVLHPVYR